METPLTLWNLQHRQSRSQRRQSATGRSVGRPKAGGRLTQEILQSPSKEFLNFFRRRSRRRRESASQAFRLSIAIPSSRRSIPDSADSTTDQNELWQPLLLKWMAGIRWRRLNRRRRDRKS